MCTERRSCRDVTDQQASHGSREAADSNHACLRHQLHASTYHIERSRDKLLDWVSHVHQQRRQLLHLPGSEQGIQERDKKYDKRHIEERATRKTTGHFYAAVVTPLISDTQNVDMFDAQNEPISKPIKTSA